MRISLGARRASALAVLLAAILAAPAYGSVSAANQTLLEGIPRLSHVFIIVLENEAASTTWASNSPAKYLNSLRSQGELLTNYYGVGHVSAGNYISLTSGEPPTPPTESDCLSYSACLDTVSSPAFNGGQSIGDQLQAKHLTWKGYFGDMPSPCFHSTATPDPYQGDSTTPPARNYADRHNPFIYYQPIVSSPGRCDQHVVPYSSLARDFKQNTVPNYAFIVPNTCDDGHDSPCANGAPGGLVSADAWLKINVPPIINYVRQHNGLLVITFDESANSDTSGCCGGGLGGTRGFGGDIGLLAISPHVPKGVDNPTPYDHASLLRTVEDSFGISQHLNDAGSVNEHAMTDMFEANSERSI